MQVWREWTNLPDGAWLWAVRWQFERRNKDSFPFLLHRIAHFISYSPSFYFLLSPSIFFLSITLSFNYYSLTLVLDPIMMMVYLLVTQHMSWGVFTESHLHILRFLFSIITFNFFLSTSSSFNNYYTYSSTRSRSDHGDGVLASHPAHVIGSSQNRIFTSSGFYFLLSLSIFFYQPHHPLIIHYTYSSTPFLDPHPACDGVEHEQWSSPPPFSILFTTLCMQ